MDYIREIKRLKKEKSRIQSEIAKVNTKIAELHHKIVFEILENYKNENENFGNNMADH